MSKAGAAVHTKRTSAENGGAPLSPPIEAIVRVVIEVLRRPNV